MYTIEKNIPLPIIPPKESLVQSLRSLEIGDSFTYNNNKKRSVTCTASYVKIRIVIHKISETKSRVWRIE